MNIIIDGIKIIRNRIKDNPNWPFYFLGIALLLGLKAFYSQADGVSLRWILAPTAKWVGALTGVSFTYAEEEGYVNHDLRFLIAPACSGVRFMTVVFVMLLFSFIHLMKNRLAGLGWTAFSLFFSYLITVFVNGFRIAISVYLPGLVQEFGLFGSVLTPERLHTILGIVIYFTALLLLYRTVETLLSKAAADSTSASSDKRKSLLSIPVWFLPPVFWYFSIVLGLPLLRQILQGNIASQREYALLLFSVCFFILLLYVLFRSLSSHLSFHIMKGSKNHTKEDEGTIN